MPSLFRQSDDSIRLLIPTPFHQTHVEEDLQRWAEANPHFLNDGVPMLSLGTEIVTRHDHSIDNMFIDGNGCLVVAELKRERASRDVIAQVLDYAAHVNALEWADLEQVCQRHQGCELASAFQRCFRRPFAKPGKIDHRLLVVAESYDPVAMDMAVYLINTGVSLTLLQFTYFEVEGSKLFEVRTVLGEIPEQPSVGAAVQVPGPDEGYNNWLFSSVAKELPEIAKRQGWEVRFRINKQSLPFVSLVWPTVMGDCQLRLDTRKKDAIALTFGFRKDAAPSLKEFLDARRDDWRDDFPAEFANPPYPSVYWNLTYDVPMPRVGDADAFSEILQRTEKMAGAVVPLISEYFETREMPET